MKRRDEKKSEKKKKAKGKWQMAKGKRQYGVDYPLQTRTHLNKKEVFSTK